MLTPSFDVSQSDSLVTVTLRVPYVKVMSPLTLSDAHSCGHGVQISEAEVHIEGCDFKFYCTPYFLHLQLPGELANEDEQKLETTTYDADTGNVHITSCMCVCFRGCTCAGTMTIRVLKRHHGEHFPNLEMLTTLLPRKGKALSQVGVKPGIEVVEPQACSGEGGVAGEEGEEFDWRVEQRFPGEDDQHQVRVRGGVSGSEWSVVQCECLGSWKTGVWFGPIWLCSSAPRRLPEATGESSPDAVWEGGGGWEMMLCGRGRVDGR